MNKSSFDLYKLTHAAVLAFLILYGLIVAKGILVPIAFAILFSMLIYPIANWMEKRLPWRALAILLSFVLALLPLLGIISFFSWQFIDVYEEMPAIWEKLQSGFRQVFVWINRQLHFTRSSPEEWAQNNVKNFLQGPVSFLGSGISSSSTFFVQFGLTFVYAFFFLFYRDAFVQFAIRQTPETPDGNKKAFLKDLQEVGQKYFGGLLIVIAILGLLNSIGLWIIGIDYPFFWGYLAAFLAVIPFIGTFVGGVLVLMYALAITDTLWQPIAVILWFNLIQFLEGNLISPKVIGESVDLNPLAGILSLIVGGSIWGIAGMVLAFPIMAILKKLMEQVPSLAPFTKLLGKDLGLEVESD